MRPPVGKEMGWTEFWDDTIEDGDYRGSTLGNRGREIDGFDSKQRCVK